MRTPGSFYTEDQAHSPFISLSHTHTHTQPPCFVSTGNFRSRQQFYLTPDRYLKLALPWLWYINSNNGCSFVVFQLSLLTVSSIEFGGRSVNYELVEENWGCSKRLMCTTFQQIRETLCYFRLFTFFFYYIRSYYECFM